MDLCHNNSKMDLCHNNNKMGLCLSSKMDTMRHSKLHTLNNKRILSSQWLQQEFILNKGLRHLDFTLLDKTALLTPTEIKHSYHHLLLHLTILLTRRMIKLNRCTDYEMVLSFASF